MYPNTSTATPRIDLAAAIMSADIARGFAALRVLTPFPVLAEQGRIPRVLCDGIGRVTKTKRAAGAAFTRIETPFDTDSWFCEERGIEEPVDNRRKNTLRTYFDAERLAARTAATTILRDLEQDVATALFNTGTFSNAAATTSWATSSTATPIADINAGKNTLRAKGIEANALLVTQRGWQDLSLCTQVRNAVLASYPGGLIPQPIPEQVLAAVLGVEQVIVAGSIYNSAAAGATPSWASIWDTNFAMLLRVAPANDLLSPRIGHTFWNQQVFSESEASEIASPIEDGVYPFRVETYADPAIDSTVVRARMFTDEVILNTNCGYLITGVD